MEENNLIQKKFREEKIKEGVVVFALLIASFISMFGIYNIYDFSLVSFILQIEDNNEKIGNFLLLGIYSGTMLYLSSLYWKKKEAYSKFKILIFLLVVLVVMIGIMFFFINNFIFPFLSLIITGITFLLFNMLFNTIGIVGVFSTVSLFSIFLVYMIKSGIEFTGGTLFTSIQVLLSLLLFVGTTAPRLKTLFFKIGTQDNVEFDGSVNSSSSDDIG
jgi:hypothetical protein